MQGEALLIKRRTWWRNRVAVPLAFATLLTQLAFVPGAIPGASAGDHSPPVPALCDDTVRDIDEARGE